MAMPARTATSPTTNTTVRARLNVEHHTNKIPQPLAPVSHRTTPIRRTMVKSTDHGDGQTTDDECHLQWLAVLTWDPRHPRLRERRLSDRTEGVAAMGDPLAAHHEGGVPDQDEAGDEQAHERRRTPAGLRLAGRLAELLAHQEAVGTVVPARRLLWGQPFGLDLVRMARPRFIECSSRRHRPQVQRAAARRLSRLHHHGNRPTSPAPTPRSPSRRQVEAAP